MERLVRGRERQVEIVVAVFGRDPSLDGSSPGGGESS